jgi:hypothetical protein
MLQNWRNGGAGKCYEGNRWNYFRKDFYTTFESKDEIMEEFLLKYNTLNRDYKSLVIEFIDFLIKRQTDSTSKNNNGKKITKKNYPNKTLPPFAEPPKIKLSPEEFRQRLLEGPTWSEQDIREMEENIKLFRSWKIEEW